MRKAAIIVAVAITLGGCSSTSSDDASPQTTVPGPDFTTLAPVEPASEAPAWTLVDARPEDEASTAVIEADIQTEAELAAIVDEFMATDQGQAGPAWHVSVRCPDAPDIGVGTGDYGNTPDGATYMGQNEPRTPAIALAAPCSAPKDEPVKILWSHPCDGIDGVAATADTIVLQGGEVLAAFDLATGEYRWEEIIHDAAGIPAPVLIVDSTVVAEPSAPETLVAFDLYSGEARPAPDDPALWLGNGTEPAQEAAGVKVVWPEWKGPTVAEANGFTIENSSDNGLRVLDASGKVVLAPRLGRREFHMSPIVLIDRRVVTMTSDGILYCLELDEP